MRLVCDWHRISHLEPALQLLLHGFQRIVDLTGRDCIVDSRLGHLQGVRGLGFEI